MKKINLGILLLATLVITLSALVSADLTVDLESPEDLGTVGGAVFNLSANLTNTINNSVSYNCSFWARSLGSTANTSWFLIGNRTNDTTNGIVNITFNSRIFEDGADYIFNATCYEAMAYNVSANKTDNVSRNVIIDNTRTGTPTGLAPITTTNVSFDFSANVLAANVTNCTLIFTQGNPGLTNYTMTHSGGACTYTATNVPEQSYIWFVRASDGTNNTDSDTQTTRIDVRTSAGKGAVLAQQEGVKSEGGALFSVANPNGTGVNFRLVGIPVWVWVIIAAVVVIGIVAVRRNR